MSFSCVTTSIKQALFIWRLDAWARYVILVLFRSFSLPSYIIRWQSSKILSFLAYVWQKRSILSTKGDILAHAVSGSDIPTVLLLLTAGNIFSTCIVLQNVSVYWTELTFERTLWVQTVLRFPANSFCTVELAFKEVQTSAERNLTQVRQFIDPTAMPFWWAPIRAAKQLFIRLPLPEWYDCGQA